MEKEQERNQEETNIEKEKLSNTSEIKLEIDEAFLTSGNNTNEAINHQTEMLEEITEDFVHVFEKLTEFGNEIHILKNKVNDIEESVKGNYKNHQIELEVHKRELIGERKSFIHQSIFHNLATTIDSLYNRKNNLNFETENALYNQTSAILENLKNLLKTIGFESFTIEKGELFRTNDMECLGFLEGEENKVIRVEKLGYKNEKNIIRPCGVIIGKVK